jgi:hypothetical protein
VWRIAATRCHIREQKWTQAEGEAAMLLGGPYENMAWPYLSAIWRKQGNARSAWLDGTPPYISVVDLGIDESLITPLLSVLAKIHRPRTPYLDQSVRGGVQTDGQLFYRLEPEIASIRKRVQEAARIYILQIGNVIDGHPLRSSPCADLTFTGSWSVRLGPGGRNVPHTHPKGRVSGTLYLQVPEEVRSGESAGHIQFGVPPEDLQMNLPAYATYRPKPGGAVFFPSTMWHSTVPFEQGERMVIAFDLTTAGKGT